MAGDPGPGGLYGRGTQCSALDDLLASVRDGQSRTLVIHGDAGIGKSALLDYVASAAAGFRVLHAVGAESEMELPFASLHQLCVPLLDGVTQLPPPQRDALEVAFGRAAGPVPDRFLVGLAVLTLLSRAAENRPVLCVVDDAQWLDEVSARTLAFVARRLLADRVGLVLATRDPLGNLEGLPELEVLGLRNGDARAVLRSALTFRLDELIRDRIVAETHGNPLALLELSRGLTAEQLADGFDLLGVPRQAIPSRLEESFRRRVEAMPPSVQLLTLIAAAEPVGDPVLVREAAQSIGVETSAAQATDGLLTIQELVRFRHPLVRSAVYRSAPPDQRRRVHLALAEATDPDVDPDRRAWHLAAAALEPDEAVAQELERCADRARSRGGVAAAAAFLQRAVSLTPDAGRRTTRALAAAEMSLQAGRLDATQRLLTVADSSPLDAFHAARAALVRGHAALILSYSSDAPRLLLDAARRLEPFDLDRAREAYLTAYGAATSAGDLGPAGVFLDICHAIERLPASPGETDGRSLLLEGLARMHTDGRAVATAILQRAARVLARLPDEDVLRWGWLTGMAAHVIWDSAGATAIFHRQAEIVRASGALAELPVHLSALALDNAWSGDLAGARLLIEESASVAAVTGSQLPPVASLRLLALEGREAEASALIAATIEQGTARGQGLAVRMAQWAASVLHNGLGHYDEAAAAARDVTTDDIDPYQHMWVLPELVEATSRLGDDRAARQALDRLTDLTQPAGTDWALSTRARSQALLSDGKDADRLYREAIERFAATTLRPELARGHLLYGEWLRREGHRSDAREQLRTGHHMFVTMGMEGFAERTRRELAATGETVRRRGAEVREELTPQEEQIARLAGDGLSNTEIGAQLFVSSRTVEWHLRKVYAKLGISSRRELSASLLQPPGYPSFS